MSSEVKQAIAEQLEAMGFHMAVEFVPLSRSRNAKEKHPTLNWCVTVLHDDKPVLTTDYSAGCAHTEAYKAPVLQLGSQNCILRDEAIRKECETGLKWGPGLSNRGRHNPHIADVMYSLVTDSDALDSGRFEDWASEYGYDTDSRKAHAIYTACLEIALKLRAGIGQEKLDKLRELFADY